MKRSRRRSESDPRVSESPAAPAPIRQVARAVEPEPNVSIKEEPVRIAMKKTVFSLKKPEKKKVVTKRLGFGVDSDDEGGLGVKIDELVKEEPHSSSRAPEKQRSPRVQPPKIDKSPPESE